ncbi:hypothetical protein ACTFIY_005107 [Dictyostelium cf. discoideum]
MLPIFSLEYLDKKETNLENLAEDRDRDFKKKIVSVSVSENALSQNAFSENAVSENATSQTNSEAIPENNETEEYGAVYNTLVVDHSKLSLFDCVLESTSESSDDIELKSSLQVPLIIVTLPKQSSSQSPIQSSFQPSPVQSSPPDSPVQLPQPSQPLLSLESLQQLAYSSSTLLDSQPSLLGSEPSPRLESQQPLSPSSSSSTLLDSQPSVLESQTALQSRPDISNDSYFEKSLLILAKCQPKFKKNCIEKIEGIKSYSKLKIIKILMADNRCKKYKSLYDVYKKFNSKMKYKKNTFLHFLFKHVDPKYFKNSNRLRNVLEIEIDSSIKKKNAKGQTPVHSLMKNPNEFMVCLCLSILNSKKIYDYSIQDYTKRTVLDYSIERADINIIKLVLLGGGEFGKFRSSKFVSNFKYSKQIVYRVMEIRKTFEIYKLSEFIPSFILLEFTTGFILDNLKYYIQYFNYIEGSPELQNWKKIIEKDQKLNWSSLLNKCLISSLNDKNLGTQSFCNHLSHVTNIDPLRGYVDMEHTIGSGGNAMVYEGCLNGRLAAFKAMAFGSNNCFINFAKEIAAVGQVSKYEGTTVVKTFGVSMNESAFLVMEMAHSNLQSKLSKPSEINKMFGKGIWKSIFKIISDILASMRCLRDEQMVHRDIKTANFLVQNDGRIVISDFGTGRDIADYQKNTKGTLLKPIGTAGYMDPLLGGDGFTFDRHCDIFSLGIVLWELIVLAMTGNYSRPITTLFKGDFQIIMIRSDGFKLIFPERTPLSFQSLINRMCSLDVNIRPSIDEVGNEIANIENEYFINNSSFSGNDDVWKDFKQKTIPIKKHDKVTYLTYNSIYVNRLTINSNFNVKYQCLTKNYRFQLESHIISVLNSSLKKLENFTDHPVCDHYTDIMFILKEIEPFYKVYFGITKLFLFKRPKSVK